ncbi:MAG: SH3 domain-containing protein [Leptolyngbya sp. IPPAS B-1204]
MKLLTASGLLAALAIMFAAPHAALAETLQDIHTQPFVTVGYADYATLVSYDPASPINVRDGASTRAYIRHIGYAGDRVEVLDRIVSGDGYMWYFVRFTVSNAAGWIRGDFVSLDSDRY